MYSWESSDQYIPDTDSRYPQFSDMQLTDRSAGFYGRPGERPGVPRKHEAQFSRTREEQYLNGALGVPSYYPCRCNACPDYLTDWPQRKPIRQATRDNDMLSLGLGGYLGPGYNCLGCPEGQTGLTMAQRSANAAAAVAPAVVVAGAAQAGVAAQPGMNLPLLGAIDNMTMLLIFMFLILVFIVVVGGRALGDLRDQIKKLKNKNAA